MPDLLKQRRTLETQITSAWEEYSHAVQLRQEAEVEHARAKRVLNEVTKQRATGSASDKDVMAAEARVNEAQDAHEQWFARANHALDAARALERDRDELLCSSPTEFAEQADATTQQALKALARAANALRDAQDAWQAASDAWLPLCRALKVTPVEPWPLPEPETLLALTPRPRGVVPA